MVEWLAQESVLAAGLDRRGAQRDAALAAVPATEPIATHDDMDLNTEVAEPHAEVRIADIMQRRRVRVGDPARGGQRVDEP